MKSKPQDLPLPPAYLREGGGRDSDEGFIQCGRRWLKLLVEHCALTPSARILDVGCGPGTVAIPLTRYLSPRGYYEGMDVMKERIDWCRTNITARFPNFHFTWLNVKNDYYNPEGEASDTEIVLPSQHEFFDVAILLSLFTHLLPGGVENYVREVAKLLLPQGIMLVAMVTYDEATEERAEVLYPHDFGTHRSRFAGLPEKSLAYPKQFMLELLERNGLTLFAFVEGNWADESLPRLTTHDLLIAKKS